MQHSVTFYSVIHVDHLDSARFTHIVFNPDDASYSIFYSILWQHTWVPVVCDTSLCQKV